MWRLLVFLAVVNVVEPDSQSPSRSALVQKFFEANKETIKSVKDDPVVATALANLTTDSQASLADDTGADLVLMDSTTACDSGWTKSTVNGLCYKVGEESSMSWYVAEDWCYSQRDGSHLTSVHSKAEAQWIAATYASKGLFPWMDNWVGLRRSCDNTTYVWTDGTPVDFLWWQPGYPGSKDPEKSCVTIWQTTILKLNPGYTPGQFDDIWDCGTNLATPTCRYDPDSTAPHVKYDTSYTCATTTTSEPAETTTVTTTTTTPTTTTTVPTTTTTTPTTTTPTTTTTVPTTTTTVPTTTTTVPTTTPTPTTATTATSKTTTTPTTPLGDSSKSCASKCGALWTPYNGGCYGLLKGTSSYATAGRACQAFGGDMVVITDANMNEAMRKAFSSNNDSTIENQAWIGASSYTNWATGKPNEGQGAGFEYCNVMALSVVNGGAEWGFERGVWTDYPCNKTQEFVICKQT